jgi:hypothetical protein
MTKISYSQRNKKELLAIWLFLIFPKLRLVRFKHIFRISNHSEIKDATYKICSHLRCSFCRHIDNIQNVVYTVLKWGKRCVISQMVSRRLLSSEARVRFQSSSFGIFGGQRALGQVSFRVLRLSRATYHHTNASFFHLSSGYDATGPLGAYVSQDSESAHLRVRTKWRNLKMHDTHSECHLVFYLKCCQYLSKRMDGRIGD